jgi:hypothetical protein
MLNTDAQAKSLEICYIGFATMPAFLGCPVGGRVDQGIV